MPYKGFYACTVGVADGKARCRNERGKCAFHTKPECWKSAPRPDVVLVKVNVNDKWKTLFSYLKTQERSYERAEQLEQDRVERAEVLGRNAYAARPDERIKENVPENADTGSQVFGKLGLADLQVSIQGVVEELKRSGYILTDAHLLERNHKPPVRLVMEFSKAGSKPEFKNFRWGIFHDLISTTFNQVDVWANDRDPKKGDKVVHTVNCGKRADGVPVKHWLHYANGDWEAKQS